MSNAESLQGMEKELVTLDEDISERAEAIAQKAQVLRTIAAKGADLKAALEENLAEHQKEAQHHQVMLHELAQQRLKGVQLRDNIKDLTHKLAVDELFAKQPTAWDVLPIRMKHHQNAHASNLVDIDTNEVDIDAVVQQWKAQHEDHRPRFDRGAVDLRGCINNYSQAVRNVCELAVGKRQIAVNVRQQPNVVLDRWLMLPDIMKVWLK